MQYIDWCIYNDYMIGILITSGSEGKLPSPGLDYGAGKSTLMLDLAYLFVDIYGEKFRVNPCTTRDQKWDKVFSMVMSFPWELEKFFMTAPKRYFGEPIFCLIDDMQMCFGKDKSHDNYIRSLKNRATTSRTQTAVVIGTAPDIGGLAMAWREFFNFEIKVPQRGHYEVQRLKKWTLFWKPYETQARLVYEGESHDFPAFPKDVQERYDAWREARNKAYDEGEGEYRIRSLLNVLTDEAKELLDAVVAKGSYTRQDVITHMEKGMELKLLQNCGLVEMFGDMVVPTRQARKLASVI